MGNGTPQQVVDIDKLMVVPQQSQKTVTALQVTGIVHFLIATTFSGSHQAPIWPTTWTKVRDGVKVKYTFNLPHASSLSHSDVEKP